MTVSKFHKVNSVNLYQETRNLQGNREREIREIEREIREIEIERKRNRERERFKGNRERESKTETKTILICGKQKKYTTYKRKIKLRKKENKIARGSNRKKVR